MKRSPFGTDRRTERQPARFLNGSVPVLIGLFIFLNPFPHVTSFQEASFYAAAFLSLILILLKSFAPSFRDPLSFSILIYLCWSILSILWSVDRLNSAHDVRAYNLEYVVLYFLLASFFCSPQKLTILIWVIIISTAIFAAWAMVYFYVVLGNPLSQRLLSFAKPQGTPVNTVAIIFLFAAVMSFFFALKGRPVYRRVLVLACCLATYAAILLTASRGALAGLAAASIVLLFSLYRKHMGKFLAMLLVLSVFTGGLIILAPGYDKRTTPSRLLKNPRFKLWQVSVEMIKDRPLHGFGFGRDSFGDTLWNQYKNKIPVTWKSDKPYEHPHNFILDVAVRLGFVGLAFFALIFYHAFRMSIAALSSRERFIRDYSACFMAALTGVLVAGLFGKIANGPAAVILYTILAMMTILKKLDSEKNGQVQADTSSRSRIRS